jgi:hypothetical protein
MRDYYINVFVAHKNANTVKNILQQQICLTNAAKVEVLFSLKGNARYPLCKHFQFSNLLSNNHFLFLPFDST